MIYIQLLWAFFQVGLTSFGGGYAAMTPIFNQVVAKHAWLSTAEFADLITISQMTPGPIALNSATFVGLQIAGIPGAIVATLGNIIPSLIIVMILGYVYFRFSSIKIMKSILESLRPAVVALIFIAAISLVMTAFIKPSFNPFNFILFLGSLFILNKTKLDPTLVMVLTGMVGVLMLIVK